MNFGRHVSNRLKNIYIWNSGVESYRMVYIWVQSEGGGEWGGAGGGQTFLDPPTRKLLGHYYEILNMSSESSAQAQSIGTLFEQIGLRGGTVDMA